MTRNGGVSAGVMKPLYAIAAELESHGVPRAEIALRMGITRKHLKGLLAAARRQERTPRKKHHHYMRGSFRDRFSAKTNVNGPVPAHRPELGPCHVWIASVASHGYGEIYDSAGEIGPPRTRYRIHRAAMLLAGHDVPADAVVMHECDRPSCVNVTHLKIGTQADNMADKHAKGREHRVLRLTDDVRDEVSALRAAGLTYKQIADRYGVSRTTLTRALSRAA